MQTSCMVTSPLVKHLDSWDPHSNLYFHFNVFFFSMVVKVTEYKTYYFNHTYLYVTFSMFGGSKYIHVGVQPSHNLYLCQAPPPSPGRFWLPSYETTSSSPTSSFLKVTLKLRQTQMTLKDPALWFPECTL